MSIDFSSAKGLAIDEGVVTQVADEAGNVLWKLKTSEPVVLEVEKITATTYAGETSYTDEEFILLDIYPKTNGTVSITYEGLSKTVTDTSGAEEPNAKQVFFGTFNGVSDGVATPASGTLVIEGEAHGFSVGTYAPNSKGFTSRCSCVTGIHSFGSMNEIPSSCFYLCDKIAIDGLPNTITTIGSAAFMDCHGLKFNDNFLKNGLTSIGGSAFSFNRADDTYRIFFDSITIPETVTYIGSTAFGGPVIDAYTQALFKRVILRPKVPPVVGGSPFGEKIDGLTFVVPKGCGTAYKSAEGWSKYANSIQEEV